MATLPPTPVFSHNKRHAMHFGRHKPPTDVVTTYFPNPKTDPVPASNISLTTCQFSTPATLDEALSLSQCHSPPPVSPHVMKEMPTRQPLPRNQSSSWWMEIRKSTAPKDKPKSRKTNHGTIATDATDEHPAFESDRFAVLTPATREPILSPGEVQAEQAGWRVKLPKPSQAQVEAYHTYKAKANLVREQDREQHVRVPSKIVSYDYVYSPQVQPRAADQHRHQLEVQRARERQIRREREQREREQPNALELGIATPNNAPTPAGTFPISPPIPQNSWSSPSNQKAPERHVQYGVQGPRAVSNASPISVSLRRKPVAPITTPTRLRALDRNAYMSEARQSASDVETGATRSTPSPTNSRIHVKVKPKYSPGPLQPADASQKESWFSTSSRDSGNTHSSSSSKQSSTGSSTRSQSPTKSYLYTYRPRTDTTGTAATSNSNDSSTDAVFGYKNEDITGTMAGASQHTPSPHRTDRTRQKADILQTTAHLQQKKRDEKKQAGSRWAWLRPLGPRVNKPSPVAPMSPSPSKTKTTKKGNSEDIQTPISQPFGLRSYIDPFIQHATPVATHPPTPLTSRPPSPKKTLLSKAPPPHPPSSTPFFFTSTSRHTQTTPFPKTKFDTGLSQITTLFGLIIKLLLIIYILVGIYFLLDAIRETMHTLGAPFRVGRRMGGYVWVGCVWVGRGMVRAWERWGVRVVVRGGWSWRGKWW